MENKNLIYVGSGLLVGVILTLAISASMGGSTGKYQRDMGMMHKMPDGSMMENKSMNMDSMMHDMMMNLDGKTGDAFDKAFLSEMIVHHQGAVVMAEAVLKVSKRPELVKLANEIISAQNKEIEMMKAWQSAWFQ